MCFKVTRLNVKNEGPNQRVGGVRGVWGGLWGGARRRKVELPRMPFTNGSVCAWCGALLVLQVLGGGRDWSSKRFSGPVSCSAPFEDHMVPGSWLPSVSRPLAVVRGVVGGCYYTRNMIFGLAGKAKRTDGGERQSVNGRG